MFVLILKYIKPLTEIDAILEAHRAFLDRYYERGLFLASGPCVPRVGGVILCRATTRDDVERIAAEDPFTQAGVVEYNIVEFNPVKAAPGFEAWIQS